MTYILFVWTVVAATSSSSYKDWRPMGEFYEVYPMKAKEVCESAAKQLGYKDEKYRCIMSGAERQKIVK